jgi:HK97 family phage prohead protease
MATKMKVDELRELSRGLEVVRALREAPQVRAVEPAADGDVGESDVLGTVFGHFSVFNTWYEINSWYEGNFMERAVPGAFAKTFTERRGQIVSAFDHGMDPVIGDKVLGPFDELSEDKTGAYYEIGLLDTSYNRDLVPALRRGLYGASFRFQTIRDSWNEEPGVSDHNPKGIPERDLVELRVFEAGPVTYPASPAATAGMRGLTDLYYERLRSRDPERVDALAERIRSLRTPTGAPDGAAHPAVDAPAASHPSGSREHRERVLARLAREQRIAALAR